MDATKVLRTQDDLVYGQWDFVVVGPSDQKKAIIREGYAQQAKILDSSLYTATLINPFRGNEGTRGIPIEELITEIPEDMKGMEVLQVDPVRPFFIRSQKTAPTLKQAVKLVTKAYEKQNIAIIQSPDEKYWGISIIKYLHDFDRSFPDPVTQAIRNGHLPLKGGLLHPGQGSRYDN